MKKTFLLSAALFTAFAASAQSLKPGLWEMTGRMMGNPEMEAQIAEMQKQLAAMPPAQRQMMESMMPKGMSSGGMTTQACLTKEMLERGSFSTQQGGECKTTMGARSGKTQKVSFTCSKPPSTGEGTITYTSDSAYTMKMHVTSENGPMDVSANGKWLGADCGSVKPAPVK
jgi:hypothetical protein